MFTVGAEKSNSVDFISCYVSVLVLTDFCGIFRVLHIYDYVICKDYFTSSFPVRMPFVFSYLTALARTSSTTEAAKAGRPEWFDFRRNTFSSCGLFTYDSEERLGNFFQFLC